VIRARASELPPGPVVGPRQGGPRAALLAAVLLALAGCFGGARPEYTWIDEYPQPVRAEQPYLIAAGDLLTVRVQGQEGMSGKSRVRDDGNISLPFLNDVLAVDLTPLQLADQIQVRLKEFVVKPVVVVSVEESRPFEASVVGNVRKAGTFPVDPRSGVLQALAAAGGLGEFADPDRIFVLRKGDRIRFTYKALIRGERRAAAFRLRAGDVVVVD
jgi:polysaccharide export outer membrane protein